MMRNRQQHQQEVQAFLQDQFSIQDWEFFLPPGTGNETYYAHSRDMACFVKLSARMEVYQAAASIGLSPPVLACGFLEDGTSIIVQPRIPGQKPSRRDYLDSLSQFASMIDKLHHSPELKQLLPQSSSGVYRVLGRDALDSLWQRWLCYRSLVPAEAGFVEESLAVLGQRVQEFQGAGLAVSHNDICNSNWLVSSTGRLYLIDLEAMSMDDPAADIGATLWWYYPRAMWAGFLQRTGHFNEEGFETRMQLRMALHCLEITLPRENSFDRFDPASFAGSLRDFKTVLAGEENPES